MKRVSASAIKTYKDCKKLFYHTYVVKDERVAFSSNIFSDLGSAVHTALELWRPTGDTSAIGRAQLIAHFKALLEGQPLYKQGLVMLYNLDLKALAPGELITTEYRFQTTVNGVPVAGIVDKIEDCGDHILVTDYKTNKEIKKHEYEHQLAVYDTCLKQEIDRPIVHELFYVRHNKSLKFTFPERTSTIVGNVVKSLFEDAQNEDVLHWRKRKTMGKPCTFCPLKKECWNE